MFKTNQSYEWTAEREVVQEEWVWDLLINVFSYKNPVIIEVCRDWHAFKLTAASDLFWWSTLFSHLSGPLGWIFDSERTIWGEKREKSIATALEKNSVHSYPVLQGYNDESTASCWQVVHISGCGLETGALCFNVQALNLHTQQSNKSVWNY